MKKLGINFIPNGPIKITNNSNETLTKTIFFNNNPIQMKSNLFICRCGRTNNQPFCDGTHEKVNFKSNKEIEKDIIQVYNGKDIEIHFNRSICSGAAKCVNKFPNIYKSASENWINPDNGSIEEVINSIKNCPSGALSYTLKENSPKETYEKEEINIIKGGPILVKGDIENEIISWSTNANKQKFALCRCGNSKNKPFCDYSHASLDKDEYTF